MNTKKIWIISVVLGLIVACFVYVSVFSKEKTSSPASIAVGQDAKEKKDQKSEKEKEKQAEKELALLREFSNPIEDVSTGKRAISIKVESQQGVSGFITPNSMVDVIAYETTKDDATKKEFKSAILVLENVKILSSGKSSDNKETALQYETVTLEVTPEQGVVISLAAQDKDGFYLMLRNSKDNETGKSGIKQTREVIKGEGTEQ
ncbi:Flp pilus assembly protein CpaB [Bacillus sp. EB106-08-02-XG196]|jgi:pilus assembly protein CpaB|uniref:Flp pilus assembly protein CpaB n=1 Tax=Bacillus sp. EB106-08-02-XG196 TaxID=2737049 RepID=UPI0015C41A6F|nr:Flp pilus assembly protein CpaB [Bacillus sp. EB106-08-02-XG196]NWQ39364.1 Flp pilus assembly protein CpaB [Bacillus sp. EB106-08-02-XG196]